MVYSWRVPVERCWAGQEVCVYGVGLRNLEVVYLLVKMVAMFHALVDTSPSVLLLH